MFQPAIQRVAQGGWQIMPHLPPLLRMSIDDIYIDATSARCRRSAGLSCKCSPSWAGSEFCIASHSLSNISVGTLPPLAWTSMAYERVMGQRQTAYPHLLVSPCKILPRRSFNLSELAQRVAMTGCICAPLSTRTSATRPSREKNGRFRARRAIPAFASCHTAFRTEDLRGTGQGLRERIPNRAVVICRRSACC